MKDESLKRVGETGRKGLVERIEFKTLTHKKLSYFTTELSLDN